MADPREAVAMAQVTGFLPVTWETCMETLVPSSSLGPDVAGYLESEMEDSRV